MTDFMVNSFSKFAHRGDGSDGPWQHTGATCRLLANLGWLRVIPLTAKADDALTTSWSHTNEGCGTAIRPAAACRGLEKRTFADLAARPQAAARFSSVANRIAHALAGLVSLALE